VVVHAQRVRHVRTKVASSAGAATTEQRREAFCDCDVDTLGQSFHDGAERLEECDLRSIAHD